MFEFDSKRFHRPVGRGAGGERGARDRQLHPPGGRVPLRRYYAGDVRVLHPGAVRHVIVQIAVVARAARHQVGDRARQRRAVDTDGRGRGRGRGEVRRVDVHAELGGGLVGGQVPVGVVGAYVEVRLVVGHGHVTDVGVGVAVGVVSDLVGEVRDRGPLRPVTGGARVHGDGGVRTGALHGRVDAGVALAAIGQRGQHVPGAGHRLDHGRYD